MLGFVVDPDITAVIRLAHLSAKLYSRPTQLFINCARKQTAFMHLSKFSIVVHVNKLLKYNC